MITRSEADKVYQEFFLELFGKETTHGMTDYFWEELTTKWKPETVTPENIKKHYYKGARKIRISIDEGIENWMDDDKGEEDLESPMKRSEHDSIVRDIGMWLTGLQPTQKDLDDSWSSLMELRPNMSQILFGKAIFSLIRDAKKNQFDKFISGNKNN